VLACAATFAVSIVVERRQQTLLRMHAAPIAATHILAGKSLACMITTLVVTSGLVILGVVAFGVRVSQPLLLAITMLCIAACFVGLMMGLSVLGKTEQSASGLAWMILLLMAMFGGGMIPLFIMPKLLQTLSHLSPIKWAILAIEGCIWRQFSAGELLLPWTVLLAVGAACFLVGLRFFRWQQ
jgi:ABC-2 type transport system permease protein